MSSPTAQQIDTATKLAMKMALLKRTMFELKELRVEYTVYNLAGVSDWSAAGEVSHLTQQLVTSYAPAIDRLDAAMQTVDAVPVMPNGSAPPIVVVTRIAR